MRGGVAWVDVKGGNIYIKQSISFPNFSFFPFHHNEKIHLCESSFFFLVNHVDEIKR